MTKSRLSSRRVLDLSELGVAMKNRKKWTLLSRVRVSPIDDNDDGDYDYKNSVKLKKL